MADDQSNARIFGVLFIITFITSIGALAPLRERADARAAVWGFRKDAPILSPRRTMAPQTDAA